MSEKAAIDEVFCGGKFHGNFKEYVLIGLFIIAWN